MYCEVCGDLNLRANFAFSVAIFTSFAASACEDEEGGIREEGGGGLRT